MSTKTTPLITQPHASASSLKKPYSQKFQPRERKMAGQKSIATRLTSLPSFHMPGKGMLTLPDAMREMEKTPMLARAIRTHPTMATGNIHQ